MKHILGVSAFYHDSAAALVIDGKPVAAAQEERFLRKKAYAGFPSEAIRAILQQADVAPRDIDAIVFYENPKLKRNRVISTYCAYAPRGIDTFRDAFTAWAWKEAHTAEEIREYLVKAGFPDSIKLMFSSHHVSHAASAYYPSPFDAAAILTMDGVGEWATTTVGEGVQSKLSISKELRFPHSLGLLYSAFTDYTGFKVNSGEYKVMGLAPYGEPRYKGLILDNLIDLKADGSFRINQDFFDYAIGDRMTNERFERLFGGPPRKPEELLTQREMDLAASIQKVTEEVVCRIAANIAKTIRSDNLCLAGGVALNCVANSKIKALGLFDEIWVQPAAGDAGGALGAALFAYYEQGKPRKVSEHQLDEMNGAFLGPSFSSSEAESQLRELGAKFSRKSREEVLELTAKSIASGSAVGWFQGRMEFGPRSLGNRSILADPRSRDTQRELNLKVKYRESFRPFAPSILIDQVSNWFEFQGESAYMLFVADVTARKRIEMTELQKRLFGIDQLNIARSEVPAITHVDYSARLQTVSIATNPLYYQLINKFFSLTGCPMLVNTSFNVRGEPIVCTPGDAFRCFMGTELDLLVIEDIVVHKREQDESLRLDYKTEFELD